MTMRRKKNKIVGKSSAENQSSVIFIRRHLAVYSYDMPGAKLKGNKRKARSSICGACYSPFFAVSITDAPLSAASFNLSSGTPTYNC